MVQLPSSSAQIFVDVYSTLVRYAEAVDRNDFEAVRGCFSPDCRIEWPARTFVGYDEFDAWLRATKAAQGTTVHLVHNSRISGGGDGTATATYYVEAWLHHKGPSTEPPAHVFARFDDELERDDNGVWVVVRRRNTVLTAENFRH